MLCVCVRVSVYVCVCVMLSILHQLHQLLYNDMSSVSSILRCCVLIVVSRYTVSSISLFISFFAHFTFTCCTMVHYFQHYIDDQLINGYMTN